MSNCYHSVIVPGNTISFSTLELMIANINWYCRLLPEEHIHGQGTAVDVILAVRHCLHFIWTFSCLSFLSFVCFLFSQPVVLCHNKESYNPSSVSFLNPSPSGWFCCLCFHSIIHLLSYRQGEKKWGKTLYSTLCIVGLGMCACFWHKAEIRKHVRRGAREQLISIASLPMELCLIQGVFFLHSYSEAHTVKGVVVGWSKVLCWQPTCCLKKRNARLSRNIASVLFLSVGPIVWKA